MTREQLSDAMGEIRLRYVEEALTGPDRHATRPRSLLRAGLAAAVIAGLLMLALPVFILFLIFRNKLMGSLTLGGLKG